MTKWINILISFLKKKKYFSECSSVWQFFQNFFYQYLRELWQQWEPEGQQEYFFQNFDTSWSIENLILTFVTCYKSLNKLSRNILQK